MKQGKFYITTTLPYVNAPPHIGFALEIVQADVIARYRRLLGEEVFFNTGTDEHGVKVYRKAREEGKDPHAYVDEGAARFRKLMERLDVSEHAFIRTTDEHHIRAAQEFWKRCEKDIEKRAYRIKYCVGCELEKTDSELVSGRCPLHPTLELEEIEEENYFFRFSRYQKPLLELYAKHPTFVVPEFRFNEIKSFVENGLNDFSISRLKEKMPWGIPVPGDPRHVMYVWFDALINYISTLGWPEDERKFNEFWPGVQIAGKDNLRQQSAMWQAMLMSAGLPNSERIIIHGFITSGGGKMSKSLGNVVDPFEVVEKYGTDALRYWLLREVPTFGDSGFTWEKFKESYNANLANGLGNLVSRVMKMAATSGASLPAEEQREFAAYAENLRALGIYEVKRAADGIWALIQSCDAYIQAHEPFRLIRSDPAEARRHILELLKSLWKIDLLLMPFLPATSERILDAVRRNREVKQPLFPRAA